MIREPSGHRWQWAQGGLWLALLGFGVVQAVRHVWVSDDVFITLRYCDNVLAGLGPVYNAGERTEGYTHFLWFVTLTLGRGLGIEALHLGRWLGLPAFLGILALLVELSAKLFPGRGGLRGLPVAALAWALHPEAQLFASGGLETSAFLFWLLLGFRFATVSQHARRDLLAGWCFGVATLTRPEGMLFSLLAAAWLSWQSGWRAGRVLPFALVWVLLVTPLFAFRLAYYGVPLPNPYYAKSGGLSNWPQGGMYLATYFVPYLTLLTAFAAVVPLARGLRHRQANAAPFVYATAAAAASILYVARVGGDFMFARFLLPASLFLVLLIEYWVQSLRRRALGWLCALVVVGGLAAGATYKDRLFGEGEHVAGIVDERQFYPADRMEKTRRQGAALARCLDGSHAIALVRGGQASLAYYARFPVALEYYGLTDRVVAHLPAPVERGRPGHEKMAPPEYLYERGVNLRFHASPVRNRPMYALIGFPAPDGAIYGDILVYDRTLMEHLRQCPGVVCVDFPRWLQETYLPSVRQMPPAVLARDYVLFHHFYFAHNPDPEGLLPRLQQEMRAAGVSPPSVLPPASAIFQDSPVGFDPTRHDWSLRDVLPLR